MRKLALLLTVAFIGTAPALAWAASAAPAAPVAAKDFSDAQRAEIESIIKDYLTEKHPEVMAQGLQNLQRREQDDAEAKTTSEVSKNKERLYNDPDTPVGGNPKGDVTVVEFYDFNCGYCKMSEDGIERLLKEDKNVKFVYKNFPILGPASVEAAKAAMAAVKQDKFQAFHDALMSKKEHLTSDIIYQTAKDVGLNVEKLKKDMEDSSVADILAADMKLGQDIGVRGTPMFVINDHVSPGALQYDQLKKIVDDAHAAGKKS